MNLYQPTITGSLKISGSVEITGSLIGSAVTASYATNLTVSGTITAQTLVVQTITSSVSVITGSTNFGTLSSNNHNFTGSVNVSGSLTVASGSTATPLFTVAGGLVGIGMNPVYKLDVGDAIRGLDILAGGNTFAYDGTIRARTSANSTTVLLHSNGSSYFLGGNVGIGTSSPAKVLDIYSSSNTNTAQLKIGDAGSTIRAYLGTFSNNFYITSGGTYAGGWTTDGTNGIASVELSAYNGGSQIVFTTANSNTSPTERMRVTSVGFLKTSNTGNYFTATSTPTNEFKSDVNDDTMRFVNTNTSYASSIIQARGARNTTNQSWYFLQCYNDGSGLNKLLIADSGNVTNTNGSYGAFSDIKLKENITDTTPKLDKLMQVKIRNYNLIGSEEKHIGVIAQELEEIFPGMIEESNDKDGEGNNLGTTTKSVKYSVFVPMLVKAIQELKADNDAIRAELAALKS